MQNKLFALIADGVLAIPAVAQAAPFAYVTNAFDPSVSVIDTANNQVTGTIDFPSGATPVAIAMTPDARKVYVTSLDAFTTCGPNDGVFVIDAGSNAVDADPIEVECEPTSIAITPDGRLAYVASRLSDTISVIETPSDEVTETITIPNGSGISSLAVSPDGQRLYAAVLGEESIVVIQTSDNTLLDPPTDLGFDAAGIAVSPDGEQIYATDAGSPGGVAVIDAAAGTVMATIPVDNHPSAVAFSPDGTVAYVTQIGINGDDEFTISKIDTASAALVGDPIEVGTFPTSVAFTPDGLQAYVGNERSNNVSVIDTADDSVAVTLSGMNSPRRIAARAVPAGHQVPDVVGGKEIDAAFALTAAGLAVGEVTREPSDSVPSGRVISQNPRADSYLGTDGRVNLVISSGRNGNGGGGGGAFGFGLLALLGLLNACRKARAA